MDQFYGGLAAGRSKARSLRDAQLATLKRYPHPMLWAAFVLVGALILATVTTSAFLGPVLPLKDVNPTRRTPFVTLALILVSVVAYVGWQQEPQRSTP